jgi:hypothetical protein
MTSRRFGNMAAEYCIIVAHKSPINLRKYASFAVAPDPTGRMTIHLQYNIHPPGASRHGHCVDEFTVIVQQANECRTLACNLC